MTFTDFCDIVFLKYCILKIDQNGAFKFTFGGSKSIGSIFGISRMTISANQIFSKLPAGASLNSIGFKPSKSTTTIIH